MFGNTSYMHIASPALEKADGYTIGCPPVLSLLCDVLYHSLKHFTLIFPYASYEDGVVVRSESPWKTPAESSSAMPKVTPERSTTPRLGAGTPEHLIMEQFSIFLSAPRYCG
jgi:tripartite-type tricarboxylate transporter receptor subunit TctC